MDLLDSDERDSDENTTGTASSMSSDAPLIENFLTVESHQSHHRRKLSDCTSKQCGGCVGLKSRQRKSHSLPSNYPMISADNGATSTVSQPCEQQQQQQQQQISPEDCATQLTLLDLKTFVAISPEEFISCCWNKHNKLQVTPNIVAFTRRFNQVSFWVVQEILKCPAAKDRAEVISYYIKIGKKLFDLRNFHSLFAIVSALRSASIYRLHKTWSYLSKRDKQSFDKLSDVFSEDDNWKNLREHVESLKLPCIPYLGMFLTDLVYIDVAHPHRGGMETEQRSFKMNNILRVISNLQQSDYNITPLPNVQQYLKSIQYIEELQKFIEDDQYKLSLKLEPLSAVNSSCTISSLCRNSSSCSSKDSYIYDHCSMVGTMANLNLSPAKLPPRRMSNGNTLSDDGAGASSKHRKSLSVVGGTHALLLPSCKHQQDLSRHLIDDSILEDKYCNSYRNEKLEKSLSCRELGYQIILEGYLKRKTIMKRGCHPAVSSWHRYWVQMSPGMLFFFSPKCFKSSERNERYDFKREPCKVWPIERYIVSLTDHHDIFFLKDTCNSKTYKFKAINDLAALTWYRTLYSASDNRYKTSSPANLITFE